MKRSDKTKLRKLIKQYAETCNDYGINGSVAKSSKQKLYKFILEIQEDDELAISDKSPKKIFTKYDINDDYGCV